MDNFQEIASKLKSKGVVFDEGMSVTEIDEVEEVYNINFPSELKHLYSIALPVSKGFYNWRDTSKHNLEYIKSALEMPLRGLLFDLEINGLWCDNWGQKTDSIEEAKRIFLKHYAAAPQMIPIYSHRYIPFIKDNMKIPVFSIMQSDIIYYGPDLSTYLEIEFGFREYRGIQNKKYEYIDFWSDLI